MSDWFKSGFVNERSANVVIEFLNPPQDAATPKQASDTDAEADGDSFSSFSAGMVGCAERLLVRE